MLDYLWEYIKRTVGRGFVLVGGGLDVVGLAIVAARGDSSDIGVAWPIVLLILAGILIVSGFYTFQEERARNETQRTFEFTPSETYSKREGGEYKPWPIVEVTSLIGKPKFHLFAAFRLRIVNHHPQDDIKVVINKLAWEKRFRLFRKPHELSDIPLVSIDGQLQNELELVVPKADRSAEMEMLFETTWDGKINDFPRITNVVMRPQIIGGAAGDIEVCVLENPKPLLRVGPLEIRESIRAKVPE